MTREWPAPLTPGDTIAVVAPSGPVDVDRLAAGVAVLESWGLKVKSSPRALERHDQLRYLAGDDHRRADDLTEAWADDEVSAVWAARGGYGAQRMVDRIDYDRLRAAGRKHFIGFSDITALHSRIGRELDQVTVHGPIASGVSQLADPTTLDQVRRMLFSDPEDDLELCVGTPVVEGQATGMLIGGNLSLLTSDLGIEPPPSVPAIVALEDIDEEDYRVDRMLTQLRRVGWFKSVAGIVLGDFSTADAGDRVRRVLVDRLADLGIPMIEGAAVGHVTPNLSLPFGASATLDATSGRLALAHTPLH